MSLDQITIGIGTMNRWPDLADALAKTRAMLGNDVKILVIDDGSNTEPSAEVLTALEGVDFRRDGRNVGYIKRRNELAAAIQTPFYLSLDDDSYPVAGDLSAAVQFALERPQIACLGFPVKNAEGRDEVASAKNEPYQARHFIGCAHLHRVEIFRRFGGYRPELVHQGEEVDFSARAFQEGFEVWHYPAVKVVHHYTIRARNWYRMDYHGARNRWLWNDWYLPPSVRRGQQCKLMAARTVLALKTRRRGHLDGIRAGWRDAKALRHLRVPMSEACYARWQALPVW